MTLLRHFRARKFPAVLFVWLVAGCVVAGCATPPVDDPEALAAFNETNDPLEPMNRVMFDFNLLLDKALLRPTAFVYKEAFPEALRDMVRNFLDNLLTPVIFANDLLQGEMGRAGDTLLRFAMNTSFGMLGIADIASDMGIERHEEDFGQTLAVAGIDEGPYLMLPFLGPTNPRDGIGKVVDFLFDPLTYISGTRIIGIARTGTLALDVRARKYEEINDLQRSSLDFYATIRSLYRQSRNDQIRNGAPPPLELPGNMSDFSDIEPGQISLPNIP